MFKSMMSMRLKYLPLLSVYFAYSFANIGHIAALFWIKNSLSLSVSEIVSIAIWANLPWSMKIIFGQLLDSIKIFGSQRRSYIFVAAGLMLLGNCITIAVANQYEQITSLATTYQLLIIAGFLGSCGFVLQDLVADTLCFEVVDKLDSAKKPRLEEDIKEEVGNIQVLVRMTSIIYSMVALFIGGIIASKYSYATISYILPCIAISSVVGSLIIRKEPKVIKEKPVVPIIFAGVAYLSFIITFALIDFKYSQEIIFLVGMIIVSVSLYKICQPLDLKRKKEILCILIVIFVSRASPAYGPGVEWWQIDVLGFTPEFYASLAQISLILSFIGLALFSKKIINRDIGLVLLILNSIHVVLQLPMIAMAFGFHEWTMVNFGFGAKTIALIDNAAEGPFIQLNFLMLCTIATFYAPKHNIASWFALVMSLMSLAYVSGGRIITRMLSEIYVVERGHYENIPEFMIVTSSINFLMPTIAILLLMNPFKKSSLRMSS
jgi:hypothetical protein